MVGCLVVEWELGEDARLPFARRNVEDEARSVEHAKKNTRLEVVLYLQQADGPPRSGHHRCFLGHQRCYRSSALLYRSSSPLYSDVDG